MTLGEIRKEAEKFAYGISPAPMENYNQFDDERRYSFLAGALYGARRMNEEAIAELRNALSIPAKNIDPDSVVLMILDARNRALDIAAKSIRALMPAEDEK